MSDPVVVMTDRLLQVEPGQSTQTMLRITNVGDQVEGYSVEVCQGPAASWTELAPRTVSLLPGQHKEVTVTFRPPLRPAAPVGEVDFGVLVVSQVDRERRAVVEGDVAVGVIHGLQAELVPVTKRGRHRGRFRLDVENTGTDSETVLIRASEAAQALSFALAPEKLEIPSGETSFAYLLVRPIRPTLIGRDESIPFWLEYECEGRAQEAGRIDGVFVRRPVLPRAILPIAAVLFTLALIAVALSLTLFPRHQPAALGSAPPETPALREVRSEADGIKITWESVPVAAAYKIQRTLAPESTDIEEVQEVKPDVNVFTWPKLPAGQQCFTVIATNAEGASDPSDVQCATVVADPATAVDQAISKAYVLYGQQFPQTDVDSFNRAQAAFSDLAKNGFPVKFADSRTSKIPASEPVYLLYMDGFGSLIDASAYCARVAPVVCQPFPPIE